MVTKTELSDFLNDMLGTTIDFSKLTKEDLESLKQFFSDPTALIQLGIKKLRDRTKKEILTITLGDILDKPVLEELRNQKGGPLGLGIVPRILELRKGKKSK